MIKEIRKIFGEVDLDKIDAGDAVNRIEALLDAYTDTEGALVLLENEIGEGRIKSRIEGAPNPVYTSIKNSINSVGKGQDLMPSKLGRVLYSARLSDKGAEPLVLFKLKKGGDNGKG